MARAYASAVIEAPIEDVWAVIRDFNGLPRWTSFVVKSAIEGGLDSATVGCVRAFELDDGSVVRERLLSLDDRAHRLSYNFETPAFPVENYAAMMRLSSVTSTGATFAEWEATFDEAPEDAGKYEGLIATDVFARGWNDLQSFLGTTNSSSSPG